MAPNAATPLADRVFVNPLAIPGDVEHWVRAAEAALREDAGRLASAEAEGPELEFVTEARAELDGILGPRGALELLLRRPLTQLVAGTPARAGFERLLVGARQRVADALATAAAARECCSTLRLIEETYQSEFPNRYLELARTHRTTWSAVQSLRSPEDAKALVRRLGRVERRLAQLREQSAGGPLASEVISGEPVTRAELALAYAERAASRRTLRRVGSIAPRVRRDLQAHLSRVAGLTSRGAAQGAPTVGPLLEGLLGRVNALSQEAVASFPDAPIWAAALAAANAARLGSEGRFRWLPTLTMADRQAVASAAPDDPPLRVLPLSDELAFISDRVDGAIRVWTAKVSLNASVDVQLAPDDASTEPSAVLLRDAQMLFDGVAPARAHWYRTAQRARLRVIAATDDGWFARIERRGRLEPLSIPGWRRDATSSGILLSGERPSRGHLTQSIPLVGRIGSGPFGSFLGVSMSDVRTGFPEPGRAWLRTATHRWVGATEAIRRERALQMALSLSAAGSQALELLAMAQLDGTKSLSPLYRIPFAFVADRPTRLVRPMVEDGEALTALIRSVARVLRSAHLCGFALGACHLEAFAFTLEWPRAQRAPAPTAVLLHAPRATPFGEAYIVHAASSGESELRYDRLGVPVSTPRAEGGEQAQASDDMYAFGAFVLDLIIDAPTSFSNWYDLVPAARQRQVPLLSRYPMFAQAIAYAMTEQAGREALMRFCDRLLASEARDVRQLEGLLY